MVRRRLPGGPIDVLWEEGGQPEGLHLAGDQVLFSIVAGSTVGLWRVRRDGGDLRRLVDGAVSRDFAIDGRFIWATRPSTGSTTLPAPSGAPPSPE